MSRNRAEAPSPKTHLCDEKHQTHLSVGRESWTTPTPARPEEITPKVERPQHMEPELAGEAKREN